MNEDDFGPLASGRLVPTPLGPRAFVPDPLPPLLDRREFALELAAAAGAVGELKGACRLLSNPRLLSSPGLLIRPLQQREALTSSAMEGTHTTGDELLLADFGLASNPDDATQEVVNYIRALEDALNASRDGLILNRTLRQAHAILLSNVGKDRGADKLPGQFKVHQNMIGARRFSDPAATLASARYIPPPPKDATNAMGDLERFINDPAHSAGHPLIDMALAHYQFEAIHPFADGNGRVGRMLVSLMAVRSGLLDLPVLYISPSIEDQKDLYIDLMYRVSARSEWGAWMRFFLEAVERACHAATRSVGRLLTLQAEYRQIADAAVKSVNGSRMVDFLFAQPAVNVAEVRTHLGVTDQGARKIIDRLVAAGLLEELPDRSPRTYLARGIFAVSEPSP